MSYKGENKPLPADYKPQKLLTNWNALGPFTGKMKEVESDGFLPGKKYTKDGLTYGWKPFKTDGRGCVVTGRLIERFSGRWFGYFHTVIEAPEPGNAILTFSTTNPLEVFINNTSSGNVAHQFVCWHDFWENPDHIGQSINVNLKKGKNHVLVRVNGGRYGGDGFYAHASMPVLPEEESLWSR